MQKFSACRNLFSPIHFFCSTRMRCMTAICPAGPPKLSAATLAHTFTASRNVMPWVGVAGITALNASVLVTGAFPLQQAADRQMVRRNKSRSVRLARGLVDGRTQAAGELDSVVDGPEMHEDQP